MNWEEFLGPDILKILLMIIFTIITTLTMYGFPLRSVNILFGGECGFDYFFMIMDIIFWYVISCVIAGIVNKIKSG
ncbi:MAG: hypothetical protein JW754_00485 [Candidatus Aenigmarchaeota archaeon]|nr:hypothetical protein [Candidatus Aenigmarchaeota archaeon]